jgi:2C-methyl-D-erythritol 2,4-cyclodiphosphate synthase
MRLFFQMSLVCGLAVLLLGCMRETNNHMANMDKNTDKMAQELDATNKKMDLLAKQLELTNAQITLMASHLGETNLHLQAFQEYAELLKLEMTNVNLSLSNMAVSLGYVGDLAELAKKMMAAMVADAFPGATEPPPQTGDDLDKIKPRSPQH